MDLGGGKTSDETQYFMDLGEGRTGVEVKSPFKDGLSEWGRQRQAANIMYQYGQSSSLLPSPLP